MNKLIDAQYSAPELECIPLMGGSVIATSGPTTNEDFTTDFDPFGGFI